MGSCPDCGSRLVSGAQHCGSCGLVLTSQWAADLSAARQVLSNLDVRVAELSTARSHWQQHRQALLDGAPRVPVQPSVGHMPPLAAAEPGLAELAASGAPSTDGAHPTPARRDVIDESLMGPQAPRIVATHPSEAREEPSLPLDPVPAPAAAFREPRRLSAAALLGVAGASLLIIGAIVFTAASWASAQPPARASMLILLSAGFAFLALRSLKSGFPVIAGSLGVVSAGFSGVSVYALAYDEGRVGPYSTPVALIVTALAAYGLSRTGLAAVASTAVVLLPSAVMALSVELGFRISSPANATAAAVMALLAGAGALLAGAKLWRSEVHRSLFRIAGQAFILCGLGVTVLGLALADVNAFLIIAWLLALVATALLGRVLAEAAAPALTAGALWGSIALLSQGPLAFEYVSTIAAGLTVLAAAVIRFAPVGAKQWAIWGLAPSAIVISVSLPLVIIHASAFQWAPAVLTDEQTLESHGWWGLANLLAVAAVRLVHPFALWARRAGWSTFELLFAVAAVTSLVTDGGFQLAGGPGAVLACALALGISWWMRRLWPEASTQVRYLIVWLWAAVGLGGAARIGAPDQFRVDDSLLAVSSDLVASVALACVLAFLALVSRRTPVAAGVASALMLVATAATVLRTNGRIDWIACAVVAASILAVAVAPWWFQASRKAFVAGLLVASPVAAVMVLAALTLQLPIALTGADPFDAGIAWWSYGLSAALIVGAPVILFRAGLARKAATAWVRVMLASGAVVFSETAIAHIVGYRHSLAGATGALVIAPLALVGALGFVRRLASAAVLRWTFIAGVSCHGLASMGHLALDQHRGEAILGVAAASVALGVVGYLRERASLSLGVGLASLCAPVALIHADVRVALLVAAGTSAILAWGVRIRGGSRAIAVARGGVPVCAVAALGGLWALWESAHGLEAVWTGGTTRLDWMPIVVLVLGYAALVSLKKVTEFAIPLAMVVFVVVGGLLPQLVVPIGGTALAVVAAVMPAAWLRRLRWPRPYSWLLVLGASAWWGPGLGEWATAATAFAVVSLAIAVLESRRSNLALWGMRAVPWSLSVATALWLALVPIDFSMIALLAGAVALAGIVIGRVTRLELPEPAVAHLSIATAVFASATWNLAYVGVFLLLASAAFYVLSTVGPRGARWVALGLLSPAVAAIVGYLGIGAVEAYTAVPALSMIIAGARWMARDASVRSYAALSPGLAMALVPTYVGLLAYPDPLNRFVWLNVAILALALAGIALRWFVLLLAMAVSAVYLALTQLVAAEPITPKWVAFAFIGALLLALGFTAEKIKTMR